MKSLKDLKVGDPVLVTSSEFFSEGTRKRLITKMTATQLTLDDDTRWLKSGRKVGAGTWSRTWCRPYDEAEHAEILREAKETRFRRKVKEGIKRADLTVEQWERIDAILSEVTP